MRAVGITTAQSFDPILPHYNLFRGWRYQQAALAETTSSDRVFTFTLEDGDESDCSYYLLARADLLLAQGATGIVLEGSDDAISWDTLRDEAINSTLLTGITQEDIIKTFTPGYDYKYYRFTIESADAVTNFSKLYLGNLFDFGSPPDEFIFDRAEEGQSTFEADSGAQYQQQLNKPRYVFTITWDGISDAKADEFFAKIVSLRNRTGFFLHNATQTQMLNNKVLAHCALTGASREELVGYPNWNTIRTEWTQLL